MIEEPVDNANDDPEPTVEAPAQDEPKAGAQDEPTPEGGDANVDAPGKKDDKPSDWRDAIKDKDAREFADRSTTVEDLAKTAIDLRKKLSRAVVVPGKDAKDEDVSAYHRALGVPDKPEDYDLSLSEEAKAVIGDEKGQERLNSFLSALHGSHASQDVARKAIDWYVSETQAIQEAHEKTLEEAAIKSRDALEDEWGENYKENRQFAIQGAKEFGGDAFFEFIETVEVDGMKLGDHPAFLKPWADVGRKISEATPLIGASKEELAGLDTTHRKLIREVDAALAAGDHARAQRLDNEAMEIAGKLAKAEEAA